MNKITPNLPESDYHTQTGEKTPLFSYSTAKTIIQESAYHAWLYHPLLGKQKKEPTKAMDKGSIIHGLLLGSGPVIVELPYDNFRKKEAQVSRDYVYSEGKIPILINDLRTLKCAVLEIKEQIKILAPYFFEPHESELSVRWEMDNGVKCQSRFDWINQEEGKIIDLKTTKDANPQNLDRNMLKYGYDIQEAMYLQAAEKTWSEMAGRFTWEFIFVEPEPPYMVSVVETDGSMSWLGESKLKRAADKWKSCLESDVWAGYGRQLISAPGWAVSREEGE